MSCPDSLQLVTVDIATDRLHVNPIYCAHNGLGGAFSLSVLETIHDRIAGR